MLSVKTNGAKPNPTKGTTPMLNHDDDPLITKTHKSRAKIPREDRSKPKGKRPWQECAARRFFFE